MDQDLARYLNDHLAGSSGALLLIQELADSHGAPEAREFFLHLKFPEWNGIDFAELELEAIQQREDIEFWRIQAAKEVLVAG